jgi:hypothetical protein
VAGVVASGAVVIVVWVVVPVVVVAAESMLEVGALEVPERLAGGAVVLVATSGNEEFADSIVGAPHPVSTKVTQTTAATANGVRCSSAIDVVSDQRRPIRRPNAQARRHLACSRLWTCSAAYGRSSP